MARSLMYPNVSRRTGAYVVMLAHRKLRQEHEAGHPAIILCAKAAQRYYVAVPTAD